VLAANAESGSDSPPGPGRGALLTGRTLPATDPFTIAVTGQGGTVGPYAVRVTFADATGPLEVADAGSVAFERSLESPPGEFSEVVELAAGFERRLPGGTVKRFDDQGLLERVTDRNGNATRYAYDAQERLVRITDPVGLVTHLRYDVDTGSAAACPEALDEIEDPAGRRTQLVHDAACNLVAIVQPDGTTRRFGYDERHRLVRKSSPRGAATPDPADFTTVYAYDAGGRIVSATRPEAPPRQYTPSRGGGSAANRVPPPRLEACSAVDPPPGCPGTAILAPPQSSLRVRFEDAEGRETSFGALDQSGNATAVTNPAGRTTALERDPAGNITRAVQPSGDVFGLGYDDTGNLTSLVDHTLSSTPRRLTYAPGTSFPTSITDAFGETTELLRDAQGNLLRVETPEGRAVALTYTPEGLVETLTDARQDTHLSYDAEGRVVEIRQGAGPGERLTSFTYTAAGDVESVTDPVGRTTAFAYDALGRVVRQTLPDGRRVSFAYDADGNLTALTPPGRPAHGFSSDARGNEGAYEPPAAGVFDPATRFTYNGEDELVRIERPDGKAITLVRNAAGELDAVEIPRGAIDLATNPLTGLVASITAPGPETLSFSYQGSRLVGESWSGTVAGGVSWGLDAEGRVTERRVNGASPVAFHYDRDGLLVGAGGLAIERDPGLGLITGTHLGEVATSTEYNAFLEPLRQAAAVAGASLFETTFTRDPLGRIVEEVETIAGTTTTFAYAYDGAGRLVEVREDGAVAATYTYDPNGNRLRRTTPQGTETGTYDAQDRLLAYDGLQYAYTENGELLAKTDAATGEETTYAYDVLGNLTEVDLPDGRTIEYVVDGASRRIGKKVDGQLVQAWLYGDPLNPVAELDGAGHVVARFIYGSRPNVPDFMVKGGTTYRILTDHLGSVRLVVDASTGAVAQRLDYDEFGQVTQDTNPGFQPFGFAGGIYDPDTGLVRFGARDYDPEIGRWTAKDPIRFAGQDANLYRYALADPVNLVDPNGKIAPLAVAALIGGGIGGISGAITAANQPGATVTSVLTSFAVGGAAGAFSVLPVGGVLGGVAVGAAASGLGNLGIQAVTGQVACGFDFDSAINSAIAGGLGSLVGAGVAGFRSPGPAGGGEFFSELGQAVFGSAVGGITGGVGDALGVGEAVRPPPLSLP